MPYENTQTECPEASPRCPISFALELLGDRWSLRLIRDMMLFDKQRYNEFLTSCSGISTNILASRLKQLQAYGLVEKFADPADGKSAIYLLTDKGVSLFPVLIEVVRWGLANDDRSAITQEMAKELQNSKSTFRHDVEQRIARQRIELEVN